MSKKIIKFTFLILIQVFSVSIFLLVLPTILINERPNINIENYQNTLSLEVRGYSQDLEKINNLNSISLNFKNPGLIGKDQIQINIEEDGKVKNEFITSGYSISDSSWIKFEFAPQNINPNTKINIFCKQDCQNLYLVGDSNNNLNLKTTIKLTSFNDSFKLNLQNQLEKIRSNNIFSILYFSLIIILNILFFITL